METITESNRKTGRLAGALFVFISVPLAIWSQSYSAAKIFISQDPAATASNLLANEFLFRAGIVAHLVSNLTFAFTIFLLYRIFKPVDKHLSRLMLAPVLVQAAVFLMLEILNYSSLMILKTESSFAFDTIQKQELSFLLLRIHRFGIGMAQLFWGLCFLPFGLIIYRSAIIPRILGVLLIISGIGYVADSFTFILLERPLYLIVQPFVKFTFIGFMLTMLWLLIKGAGVQKEPT